MRDLVLGIGLILLATYLSAPLRPRPPVAPPVEQDAAPEQERPPAGFEERTLPGPPTITVLVPTHLSEEELAELHSLAQPHGRLPRRHPEGFN